MTIPAGLHDSRPPLARRGADLERLANEHWDLLIVGGGIVGAGALLDAASRGMRVALVEQEDIAAGTSSRSSRLIHGGLRYLQRLEVGLVREALVERARLLRLAPHLVRLEAFLFPLYGPPAVTRAFYEAGLTMYDLLGSRRTGGGHRHLGLDETLAYAPSLVPTNLRGSLLYHDAMEDDARFALAVVRTAQARFGEHAVAVTRVRALGPLRGGSRNGDPVAGARVEDRLTGESFDVRAPTVLDATGVWGALPARPFGAGSFSVLPSRGAHLVVPRDRIPARGGMTLRIPGRVGFLVPWPRHWIVGTTDTPHHGPVERIAATSEDVDGILATVNGALDVELTRDDLVGTYAGLRPLVAPSDATSSVRISREHRVSVEGRGLVRVSGGKYTTYRVMARDAVDAALGPDALVRPSRTLQLPIHGAARREQLDALADRIASGEHRLLPEVAQSLVDRHGTDADAVLAYGAEHDLIRRLVDGAPFLEAEIAWAVEREMALTLDDLLARRMRLAPTLPDRGATIAPRAAQIAGHVLGWDRDRQASEVAAYLETARGEYGIPA
jgi:glycerol-3-phosphate dehydrogenase